jgi:hypothetical protein
MQTTEALLAESIEIGGSRIVFSRGVRRRQVRRHEIASNEAIHVISYLEDPVGVGLWRLSASWKSAEGVSADLWREIELETQGKDTVQIRAGKRERKIRVTDEWKEGIHTQVCDRISFLMSLFQFLAQQAAGQAETQDSLDDDSDEEQTILDLVDTSAIGDKYSEALAFFQSNLYHPSFRASTVRNKISRLKAGPFILLAGPRDGDSVVLVSWTREPLHAMGQFLQQIGKIDQVDLMPIFSPEEEAFAPYFNLLGMVREHLVRQAHLGPIVEKALANFSESNYTESVSALGLAGEDVLTQIFETLFREQLTKGLTLGQLVDEVNGRTAALFPRKEDPVPDLSNLFGDLNQAITDGAVGQVDALPILRKFLAQVIEANKYLNTKLDKLGVPERKISIFPPRVQQMLTELIRFRNAASHRSRVPIGPYECRRAAYAFVVLHGWWEREKRTIDWTRSPKEIVVQCAQRAGG